MGGTGVRAYERLGWLHPSRCNQEPLIGKKKQWCKTQVGPDSEVCTLFSRMWPSQIWGHTFWQIISVWFWFLHHCTSLLCSPRPWTSVRADIISTSRCTYLLVLFRSVMMLVGVQNVVVDSSTGRITFFRSQSRLFKMQQNALKCRDTRRRVSLVTER